MLIDPRGLAALLLGHPGIRSLHAGPLGAISTETGAGPVVGVLIRPGIIVLGLVVESPVDRDRLARRLRGHLASLAPGVPVSLSIVSPGPDPPPGSVAPLGPPDPDCRPEPVR